MVNWYGHSKTWNANDLDRHFWCSATVKEKSSIVDASSSWEFLKKSRETRRRILLFSHGVVPRESFKSCMVKKQFFILLIVHPINCSTFFDYGTRFHLSILKKCFPSVPRSIVSNVLRSHS